MAKKQFKAESKRLMDLMVNSIYTHKEIFLREIISNASDAIDKLAYLSLTDDTVKVKRGDMRIIVTPDKDTRTLTVSDNGVGMTAQELEQNLGTIARSGSLQFKEGMEKDSAADIIGQFGVGFYSAFMVADEVTTGRTRPTAGSPPGRTATPSPNAKRTSRAPTSSCTSRPTARRKPTASTWRPAACKP